MWMGHATPSDTELFASNFPVERNAGFFHVAQGLSISSIGLGSYLGAMDDAVDAGYRSSVHAAISLGVNFIDTSLNYRHQRSERAIGGALSKLFESKTVTRNQVVVCTKAGYLVPHAVPATLTPHDVVGKNHSLAPHFLADQLERSRQNLGLETIDVFYLHNPETQLAHVSDADFYSRLELAFSELESFVEKGLICWYGAATWNGFRVDGENPHSLSLSRMAEVARKVGGNHHHFRFVQAPFNLSMKELFASENQTLNGYPANLLTVANELEISLVASASLLQARLARDTPDGLALLFPGTTNAAQRALQFTRSAPGLAVALVGMSNPAHVAENLALARIPQLSAQEFRLIFAKK
jgi:aryl-alcohol dehydrogenase-like predicted oxidoreductase